MKSEPFCSVLRAFDIRGHNESNCHGSAAPSWRGQVQFALWGLSSISPPPYPHSRAIHERVVRSHAGPDKSSPVFIASMISGVVVPPAHTRPLRDFRQARPAGRRAQAAPSGFSTDEIGPAAQTPHLRTRSRQNSWTLRGLPTAGPFRRHRDAVSAAPEGLRADVDAWCSAHRDVQHHLSHSALLNA